METVSLDELLRRSDVISLHCPLFPETANIISRENIAKMKDGAMLINTARGALMDEQAVADALAAGKLRGAAVDVATVEPMRKDNPLLSAPNCLITPHMAWAPLESRRRLLNTVADNVRCFLEGNPQNVGNGIIPPGANDPGCLLSIHSVHKFLGFFRQLHPGRAEAAAKSIADRFQIAPGSAVERHLSSVQYLHRKTACDRRSNSLPPVFR